MPSDPQPARARRKDAALNRERLVQAAREVFARQGLGATLEDIAQHAGVGIGTVYRNFASKEEIVDTLYRETLDAILVGMRSSLEIEDPWKALVTFFELTAEAQARDRGLCEIIVGNGGARLTDALSGEIADALTVLFDKARAAGVIRGDASATDVWPIFAMLYTLYGVSEQNPDLWRRYLALLLDGLRAGDRPALPGPPLDIAAMRSLLATAG